MADAGVAADQDELARRRRLVRNSSSSQNSPFTVTSMTSSGVSLQVARWTMWVTPATAFDHRRRGRRSIRVTTSTRSLLGQGAIVAERANPGAGKARILEQACNEVPPDLAGCASYEDQHALPPEGRLANIGAFRPVNGIVLFVLQNCGGDSTGLSIDARARVCVNAARRCLGRRKGGDVVKEPRTLGRAASGGRGGLEKRWRFSNSPISRNISAPSTPSTTFRCRSSPARWSG